MKVHYFLSPFSINPLKEVRRTHYARGPTARGNFSLYSSYLYNVKRFFKKILFPVSLFKFFGHPRLIIKRLKLLMHESVEKLGTTSNNIFLAGAHVSNVNHTFFTLQSFLLDIFFIYI